MPVGPWTYTIDGLGGLTRDGETDFSIPFTAAYDVGEDGEWSVRCVAELDVNGDPIGWYGAQYPDQFANTKFDMGQPDAWIVSPI